MRRKEHHPHPDISQFLRRVDEVDAKFSRLLDETANVEDHHELSSQWMQVRLQLERDLLDKVIRPDGVIGL